MKMIIFIVVGIACYIALIKLKEHFKSKKDNEKGST